MSAPTGCSLPLRGRNAGVVSAAAQDEGAYGCGIALAGACPTVCQLQAVGVDLVGGGGLRLEKRDSTLLSYVGTANTQCRSLCRSKL